MPNTYHQIYLQTVFAVKYRNAVLAKSWRSQVFGVIGNLINEANCKTISVICGRFLLLPLMVQINADGYEVILFN